MLVNFRVIALLVQVFVSCGYATGEVTRNASTVTEDSISGLWARYENVSMDLTGTSFHGDPTTETAVAQKPMPPRKYVIPPSVILRLLRTYLTFRIAEALQTYVLPIIVPIGLVGNSLSLAVMLQKRNRRIPCNAYIAALAVSDNVMMLLGAYSWFITDLLPKYRPLMEWFQVIRWECKITSYFFMVSSISSIYIVISMTFNRVLAVVYPLKVKAIGTMRNTKITIAAIFVLNLVYATPQFFLVDMAMNGVCVGYAVKNTFSQVWAWVNITISSLIPVALLLSMNTRIIMAIRQRGKFLAQNSTGNGEQRSKANNDNQLTMMLLLVAFMLLILSMPLFVRYILAQLIDYEASLKIYAEASLLSHASHKLFVLNSALNFFLYCIGGSRFRRDLRRLFPCCADPKKTSSASSTSMRNSSITMQTTCVDG